MTVPIQKSIPLVAKLIEDVLNAVEIFVNKDFDTVQLL